MEISLSILKQIERISKYGKYTFALLTLNEYCGHEYILKALRAELLSKIALNDQSLIKKLNAGYKLKDLDSKEIRKVNSLIFLENLQLSLKKSCIEKEYCLSNSSSRLYFFCNSRKSLESISLGLEPAASG